MILIKAIILLIVSSYCCTVCYAQVGWFTIESGVIDNLYDIAFPTVDSGFVVGVNKTALRTTDGGRNWQKMTLPSQLSTHQNLYATKFISWELGFIIGSGDSGNFVLRTTDGGESWIRAYSHAEGVLWTGDFPTINVGYAAGYLDYDTSSCLVKTTDGGQNWMPLPEIHWRLNSISFRDGLNGLAAASTKYKDNLRSILRTTDGGITWIDLGHPAGKDADGKNDTTEIYTVKYLLGNEWLAGTEDKVTNTPKRINGIFRSTDDGTTWTKVDTNSTEALGIYDNRIGFALTEWRQNPTTIRKTTNGGLTWFSQILPQPIGNHAVAVPSESVAYIVGQGGIILKTTDGGGSPLSVHESSQAFRAILSVQPNPTTDQLQFNFTASGMERHLILYDLLGRVVFKTAIAPEATRTNITTDALPSGIYLCRLGDQTVHIVVAR